MITLSRATETDRGCKCAYVHALEPKPKPGRMANQIKQRIRPSSGQTLKSFMEKEKDSLGLRLRIDSLPWSVKGVVSIIATVQASRVQFIDRDCRQNIRVLYMKTARYPANFEANCMMPGWPWHFWGRGVRELVV